VRKAERNAGPLKPRASQISTEEEKPKKSKLHPYPTVVVLGQQFTCQLPAHLERAAAANEIARCNRDRYAEAPLLHPRHRVRSHRPFPKCRWDHTEIRPCYCFALFIGT
jgi:hypothetical protein